MGSLHFSPRVPVVDANVCVGDARNELSPCRSRDTLLAEMDRRGVQRALIHHAQAVTQSPLDGNPYLQTWLGSDGRTIPQWVVLPTSESLEAIRGLHAQGKVGSVRLYDTASAGLPFRPWAWHDTLSWLSAERIPLFLSLSDSSADDVVTTLSEWPDLVTVLLGAHYTHASWVRPMLTALPRACLELSRYEPIGEIEALKHQFGAERLIYGSWYPRYAMGPMLYYLHHCSLTDAELTLICSGNLERILQGAD